MNIGTLLRKLRDSRALTTRAIAERIGVSASTYMDWEHDKSSPSIKSYVKLASALEVNPVDLMAYLTGQQKELLSIDEKASIAELKEMITFYKGYSDLLRKNNFEIEVELERIRHG
jgi:transcriptional regulator with XRE-family HTH domain